MRTLLSAQTPALILDHDIAARNMARMRDHIAGAAAGATLRPHLKTAKSLAVADMLFDGAREPITVSTLREAEIFGRAGFTDIVYAVGISPQKLERVAVLRAGGIDLKIVTDNLEMAQIIGAAASDEPLPTLIEIDVDGHRAGLAFNDEGSLVEVAKALGTGFAGIITHAGGSYALSDQASLAHAAEDELARSLHAADILRKGGHDPGIVSIGSTPTGYSARDLSGISEFRAGVYMFCDLVMHGVGVCRIEDIALSVLATVIGTYPERGTAIVDAGWMALSRDRGTHWQAIDQGYGIVCDLDGNPLIDVLLTQANQEHGILSVRDGSDAKLPDFRVGDRVRILPNHACATAAQHARYEVVRTGSIEIVNTWERFGGW